MTSAPRAAAAWTAGATVLAGGLNYAYTILLAAFLPADAYAVFAGGQALLLVAGTVATAAVPWVLAQELARAGGDRAVRAEAVWFAVVVSAAQGVLATLLVVGAASGFAGPAVLALLGASCLGFFVASTAVGWAQGEGRFRLVAVLVVTEVVVKVGTGVALVAFGAGVAGALTGALAGTLAVAGAGAVLIRRDLRPSRAAVRVVRLWRGALGMVGVQGLVTATAAIDVVLVVVLLPAGPDSASYQVATALGRVGLFLALGLAMVAFPALSRRPGDRALISANASALLCLVLPLLVVTASAPVALVELVLPPGYERAAQLLPLTAATGAVLALVTLQASWFKAAGAYRGCTAVLLAGALVTAGAVWAGARLGGVTGLGAGALLGALAQSAGLFALGERTWPAAQRPALGTPLLATLAAAPLPLVSAQPVVWSVLSTSVLAVAAWVALGPAPAPRLERSIA